MTRQRPTNKKHCLKLSSLFYAQGCRICEESTRCCLDAHHTAPTEKKFSIYQAKNGNVSRAEMIQELEKCVCLCRNCHIKVHNGIQTIPNP